MWRLDVRTEPRHAAGETVVDTGEGVAVLSRRVSPDFMLGLGFEGRLNVTPTNGWLDSAAVFKLANSGRCQPDG